MSGKIYFSFLFCLLTNPLTNVFIETEFELKFGWTIILNLIFVVSCIVFLSGLEKIEEQLKKIEVWNKNREREIIALERRLDELKKEKEKT